MSGLTLRDLQVKLFADGASLGDIAALAKCDHIAGFTTNPTLMRKAGVTAYLDFVRTAIGYACGKPISFEVFADDEYHMALQAERLTQLGSQVYVKIPVTNTQGSSMIPLMRRLSLSGVKVNATAVMTRWQIHEIVAALRDLAPSIVSVFAGRIADTGRDPSPTIATAIVDSRICSNVQVLWASTRELYNIIQADELGCDIITVPGDILKKLPMLGKDLDGLSRETVQMFYDDAVQAGYSIEIEARA